jgi:putative membrane protein
MKRLLIGLSLALPIAGFAASPSPDASFYKKAAEGGMAEVDMGEVAQSKATNPGVKDFGAMMVSDHSAANDKLKALAASKSIDLPTSPSMDQMATKKRLQMMSGDSFDKAYIKDMIKDHQEDIKEFQQEANSGKDPDARAYAAATLPTLQKHLDRIRQIATAAGVSVDSDKLSATQRP